MSVKASSMQTQQQQDDDFQPAIIKPKSPSYLQRLKYQYDVNFGLYMLTPAEQLVINGTLTLLVVLLVFAIYTSMPNHVKLMVSRFWDHVEGRMPRVLERAATATQRARPGDAQAFA